MRSESWFRSAVACVAAVLLSAPAHGQVIDLVTDVAPVVREAVPAVLDLFEQYSIVALSEGPHNNQKGHDFRLALVRVRDSARSSTTWWSNSATPGIKR